jgi:hypothetical protein
VKKINAEDAETLREQRRAEKSREGKKNPHPENRRVRHPVTILADDGFLRAIW